MSNIDIRGGAEPPEITGKGKAPGTSPSGPQGGPSLWSIRRLLIIGLASLQLVSVGAVALVTYFGAHRALSESYQALARQVARDAVTHAQDLLSNASAAVGSVESQIRDGVVDPADQQRLALLLFEALKQDPQLDGLYYGTARGDFVYVMRQQPGSDDLFRVKSLHIDDEDRRIETVVLRDLHWRAERELDPAPDDFLPLSRPWYRKALEAGGGGWTAPYNFYSSRRPGITYARPLVAPSGQVTGVIGGDIELVGIARFLEGLHIGPHGRAMIASRAGGTPLADPSAKGAEPPGPLLPLTPIEDPALSAALLQGRALEKPEAPGLPETYRFEAEGARYFAVTAPFTADLPWTLLIAVPEADYLGWFYDAQRSALLLSVAVGLVSLGIGFLIWRGLAGPLERLRRNARAVQRGAWNALQPTESRLSEIRETEAAFLSMAKFLSREQQANQMLLRRLRKLAAAVEQSPAAVLITDSAGQIEYANPAFEQLTFHAASSVFGQSALILAAGVEDQDIYHEIVRHVREGIVWRGENRIRRADGSVFDGLLLVAPVRNSAGRAANSVVILEDVTDERARERAVAKALDVAITANQARAEFLAHMSHDLRTPLNAILGFSDMMCSEMFGPLGHRRYQEYAGDIRSSGEYLLKIVNQILDVAQAESASLALIEEEVAPLELVESARRLMLSEAVARGTKIEVSVAESLTIWADATKLHQVIVNLLSNAVKFTPENGRVEASAVLPSGGGLELRIADTGCGMTPEQIELAMQPFIRVENDPLVRKNDGVGLGLPIAKRLIQLHGGSLIFDSAPGRGTTAIIWLPPERLLAPHAA